MNSLTWQCDLRRDPAKQNRCRFVYGYGIDGSDLPSYLVWPRRGDEGRFWFMDPITGKYFDPDVAPFMKPVGLEHFFDAFGLGAKRDIRSAAAEALAIPLDDIRTDLVVEQSSAKRFHLVPISVPEAPPAKRARKSKETENGTDDTGVGSGDVKIEQESSDESDSDSSATNSDFSSEDGSSEESDLERFEEAFAEFGSLSAGLDNIEVDRSEAGITSDDVPGLPLEGGLSTLQTLANVPKTWPLARLTIPLVGFSKQLERLLEGYCMEIIATNSFPEQHLPSVKQFAKDLVLLLAFHLAERIASLLRQVLDHPSKVLYDPETKALFLPQF